MYSRRNIIVTFAGGSLVGFAATHTVTKAQAQTFDDLRRSAIDNFNHAVTIAEFALDSILGVSGVPNLNEAERRARDAVTPFDKVGKGNEFLRLVRVERLDLAEKMWKNNVDPNPATNQLPVFGAALPRQDKESFLDVLWDILLETIGLDRSVRSIFDELVTRFEAREIIKEISVAVRKQDWFLCGRLLRHLFVRILSVRALSILEKNISKVLMQRLLMRLSAYGIPALGWTLLVVATLFAIIKNFDRLEAAIMK